MSFLNLSKLGFVALICSCSYAKNQPWDFMLKHLQAFKIPQKLLLSSLPLCLYVMVHPWSNHRVLLTEQINSWKVLGVRAAC